MHLGALADAAIERLVRRQAGIGLDVISDGEFRRWMFLNSFYAAVDGIATDRTEVEFTNERGETVVLTVPSIETRLVQVDSPAAREAEFMARITDRPLKVAFPAAPIFVHPFGVAAGAYPSHDDFVEHAIAIERELTYRSHWLCAGSLEPVAERLFGLPYDVFLVEWDDVGRDGGYESLRFTPFGRIVAMGLVSSKWPKLESEDDVLQQLDEASRYLPLDQLALSTQCGFASVLVGNEIDEDTQWRKLDLVARVADRVWPR